MARRESEDEVNPIVMAKIVDDIKLQCNCDLDNWEPERSTGHSWMCRVHKKALEEYSTSGRKEEEKINKLKKMAMLGGIS